MRKYLIAAVAVMGLLLSVTVSAQSSGAAPMFAYGFACSSTSNPGTGWGNPLCEHQWSNQMVANLSNALDLGMQHCWTYVNSGNPRTRFWTRDNNGNLAYAVTNDFNGTNPLNAVDYQNGQCHASIPRTDSNVSPYWFELYLPTTITAPIGIAASIACPATSNTLTEFTCGCPSGEMWLGGEQAFWGVGHCGVPPIQAANTLVNFDPPCSYHGNFADDGQAGFVATSSKTEVYVQSTQFGVDNHKTHIYDFAASQQPLTHIPGIGDMVGGGYGFVADTCRPINGVYGCYTYAIFDTYPGEYISVFVSGYGCIQANGEVAYQVKFYPYTGN